MCRKCFEQKWSSSLSYYDDRLEEETLKQDRGVKDVVEGLHQLSLPCRDDKFKIRSSRQCKDAEHVIDDCMKGLAVVGGVVLGAAALFGIGLAVGLGSKESRRRRY
ncbi:unnamed protein product [Schistosoma spindalis]|nr:unnamed protein product [Schistosoma spindale]CAI2724550.1 unnamed protein product [Schistosoma spindale]